FGAAGPYEKIVGTLHFAVDPSARVHESIVDLARAPWNAQGHVECSADFAVLRPLAGGNRRLLFDVPNPRRQDAAGMVNRTARPAETIPPRVKTSATAS